MAVKPWGVQMCQLISFSYLQAAYLQPSWARSRIPWSRLNHWHKQDQTTTMAGLLHFLFLIRSFIETQSRVRRQRHVITVQMEREGGEKKGKESVRVRKMNRMSWHRPLTAPLLCPIKSVIYDHVSSMCDAAKVQTHTASRTFINLTGHSNSTEGDSKLTCSILYFCLKWTGESRDCQVNVTKEDSAEYTSRFLG